MQYASLDDFLNRGKSALSKGPVAVILVEDLIEVDTTIRHHQNIGFKEILVLAPPELSLPAEMAKSVHRITFDIYGSTTAVSVVNRLIAAAPDIWMYYCYNAEYLFYPFCESRTIGEILAFHTEERRDAVLTYVVDLYADNLDDHPNAVSLEDAHLDKSGYYALARFRDLENEAKERQLDFFGGLRWRFEEHVPYERRRIDRIALFKTAPGLQLREDHTFNIEEYNTYACPWHHNITASICSFRTAKALKRNPGSMFEIDSFIWHNSTSFDWHSQQLLDLGLMEPGQWF